MIKQWIEFWNSWQFPTSRRRQLEARIAELDERCLRAEVRCAFLERYRQEWRDRAYAAEHSLRQVREGKETGWEYFAALKTAMKDGKVTGTVAYGDFED